MVGELRKNRINVQGTKEKWIAGLKTKNETELMDWELRKKPV